MDKKSKKNTLTVTRSIGGYNDESKPTPLTNKKLVDWMDGNIFFNNDHKEAQTHIKEVEYFESILSEKDAERLNELFDTVYQLGVEDGYNLF